MLRKAAAFFPARSIRSLYRVTNSPALSRVSQVPQAGLWQIVILIDGPQP
jgi:hypothetical protein